MRRCAQFLIALAILISAQSSFAFALLGPFAPWMTTPLAYQLPTAIGGPMLIGEGYRWNIPVITYSFDQSFLNYFGTNGVAAVRSAIQILNNLPPASQIDLSTYQLKSNRVNFNAEAGNLVDLKSQALVMLVEQMGLAQPVAYTWSLRNFAINSTNGAVSFALENRNYDPVTQVPSDFVNNFLIGYTVYFQTPTRLFNFDSSSNAYINTWENGIVPTGYAYASPGSTEPPQANDAVAENESGEYFYGSGLRTGTFFFGLTRDDVGGLAYLLSTNTISLESLLPDVHGTGVNATNFVVRALRPGVDKINFQPMSSASPILGTFQPVTNQYVDTYITNGIAQQQTVERIVTRPEILFTAKYLGWQNVSRTGTTNWINNGAPGHDGPGVIQPPIVINFNRPGPSFGFGTPTPTNGADALFPQWGSFDATTNAPVIYPNQSVAQSPTEFHLLLNPQIYAVDRVPSTFTWNLPGQPNSIINLQTSSDLSNWLTITAITNQGGTFTYYDLIYTNSPQRYFRTIPQ